MAAGRGTPIFIGMKRLAFLILLFVAVPLTASAQTWPGWPGPPPAGYDPSIARAEQHNQAMERLRLQADRREADAARMRLQTERTVRQLEAARAPAPATPPPTAYAPRPTPLPAPADQKAPGAAEIDAWLSRSPH